MRKTPTTAVTAQFILSVMLGFLLPVLLSPQEMFILSLGFVLVIAVIFIYVVANVGVVVYYWRERRSEFNWFLHFILPVGTSIVLLYSLYKSFTPFPAYPYNWSPAIVGVWFLIGVGVLALPALEGRGLVRAGRRPSPPRTPRRPPEALTDPTHLGAH